jgi:hypothetical protein
MPRHSIGSDASSGPSVHIQVKVPPDFRERLRAVLKPGEDISKLTRKLLERELVRRESQPTPPTRSDA